MTHSICVSLSSSLYMSSVPYTKFKLGFLYYLFKITFYYFIWYPISKQWYFILFCQKKNVVVILISKVVSLLSVSIKSTEDITLCVSDLYMYWLLLQLCLYLYAQLIKLTKNPSRRPLKWTGWLIWRVMQILER